MLPDPDYAAALLLAAEPTDRALAGWGGNPRDWAAWTLRNAARRQAFDDPQQPRHHRGEETP